MAFDKFLVFDKPSSVIAGGVQSTTAALKQRNQSRGRINITPQSVFDVVAREINFALGTSVTSLSQDHYDITINKNDYRFLIFFESVLIIV